MKMILSRVVDLTSNMPWRTFANSVEARDEVIVAYDRETEERVDSDEDMND